MLEELKLARKDNLLFFFRIVEGSKLCEKEISNDSKVAANRGYHPNKHLGSNFIQITAQEPLSSGITELREDIRYDVMVYSSRKRRREILCKTYPGYVIREGGRCWMQRREGEGEEEREIESRAERRALIPDALVTRILTNATPATTRSVGELTSRSGFHSGMAGSPFTALETTSYGAQPRGNFPTLCAVDRVTARLKVSMGETGRNVTGNPKVRSRSRISKLSSNASFP